MEAELLFADRELRRFIKAQYENYYPLGYPSAAAFARDIARGTVSLPPTPQDPLMDQVGVFYHGLKQIERRVISEYYGNRGSFRRCARVIGVSVGRFFRFLNKLLWRCYSFLDGRGLT